MAKKQKPKSSYHLLKQQWLRRHSLTRRKLRAKHKEAIDWIIDKFPAKEELASGAIGLLMMSSLIPTSTVLATISQTDQQVKASAPVDRSNELMAELRNVVPDVVRPLTGEEEAKISQILSGYFSLEVKPDMGGLRLNRTYGIIGAEQHLVRFPGDTLANHVDVNTETGKLFYASGMAAGRGAWGYFAKSRSELTQIDIDREKWYIAVQTFAAPDYNLRLSSYRDFFKYRKMLVCNVKSGQAAVVDIADSGPAIWTGKHLGGSPEVMYSLGLVMGPRKGKVLYFFVDDAGDKIALGPIKPTGA